MLLWSGPVYGIGVPRGVRLMSGNVVVQQLDALSQVVRPSEQSWPCAAFATHGQDQLVNDKMTGTEDRSKRRYR